MKLKAREWWPQTKDLDQVEELYCDKKDFLYPGNYESGPHKQCTITIFTGLTDMFHVDIYEGDILKDANDTLMSVEFIDGCFVAIIDGNVECNLFEICDSVEIVGNIFENPELLEDKR